MKLDKQMCALIADLEFIIGSECYNPNSYDGWNNIEGCAFRYPINIPNSKGNYIKIKTNINKTLFINEDVITPNAISHMKYKFGSNELHIGRGIIKLLESLEERYNIDFNELEKGTTKNL